MISQKIYLDTYVVIWLYAKELNRFSDRTLNLLQNNRVLISPMVKLELQYLYEIGRINYTPEQIIEQLSQTINLNICQKPWIDIVNIAKELTFTRDTFDRLITAHAMLNHNILLSKDKNIAKFYHHCLW